NGDGKPDLIGLPRNAREVDKAFIKPVQLINHGMKNYHYQTIRPRAAKATGDQRINSFGIGGEIEIRSGLLTQKQVITSPLVHFGLGEQTQTDVARIVWPNGSVQAEFELKADQSILAEQRLKGSCPSLFAWDGRQMSSVKDCAPSSPAFTRLKSGSKSRATGSRCATGFMTCGSRRSCGRLITLTITRSWSWITRQARRFLPTNDSPCRRRRSKSTRPRRRAPLPKRRMTAGRTRLRSSTNSISVFWILSARASIRA